MMRVSAAACVAVLMMTSPVARVEDLVERASAEKFSENLLGITEHEREAAEDEVILERIVLVPSTVVVVAIVRFIVS